LDSAVFVVGYLKKSLNMLNPEKNTELAIEQAIQPIVECQIPFSKQRMLLNEMFASTVSNAPDDEIDNWTAKRITPFYLAMCQLLENLDTIGEVHTDNINFSMG
jgi:hypothetical protein